MLIRYYKSAAYVFEAWHGWFHVKQQYSFLYYSHFTWCTPQNRMSYGAFGRHPGLSFQPARLAPPLVPDRIATISSIQRTGKGGEGGRGGRGGIGGSAGAFQNSPCGGALSPEQDRIARQTAYGLRLICRRAITRPPSPRWSRTDQHACWPGGASAMPYLPGKKARFPPWSQTHTPAASPRWLHRLIPFPAGTVDPEKELNSVFAPTKHGIEKMDESLGLRTRHKARKPRAVISRAV